MQQPTAAIELPGTHAAGGHSSPDTPPELRPITRNRQILVLISGFLTICITIGFNQSYGVFQNYYISPTQTMLPKSTRSDGALVAFIGTLGYGLTWSGSIFVNPAMARLGVRGNRGLGILGVCFMSLGFLLASFSTQYFTSHRGSAMGFILSGAGVGGLVFSPLIRALLTAIGPRWTLRLLALLNLTISLPVALTSAPSRFIGRRPTHVDLKLALKPAFLFSAGAAFLQAGGNGLPATFLPEYSVALGYSASAGASLLAVSNAVNSVSRIVTGYAGDKCGRQNTLIVTVLVCVMSVLGLWLESTQDGGKAVLWVLFVVCYGVAGGGYNALFPTTVAEVFGIHAYASVNGFMYFIRGLGTMAGSPIGGQILGESKLVNYKNVVWFDAALLGGAALCVVGVRWWDAVEKRSWKWRA
ncbi:hypothetical protein OIDMADRAFT_105917 [Oidiodendron maius Zn]|uniref:Major facilitator superfamily (MFS) profile domain-containing protein n=1 Tax=Oidiodendron maius (strain Zn) TaxID=913774 RepID=A0A0C3GYR2_OIDMZ|nr:hypothetical protein OIDMADRAFT_105917 [Oidiodendron maius Zn]